MIRCTVVTIPQLQLGTLQITGHANYSPTLVWDLGRWKLTQLQLNYNVNDYRGFKSVVGMSNPKP